MESTVLVKAFGLLEATAGRPNGRSLGELAAEVGLTKPTTHRILKTLVGLGYVERPAPGVYRQTSRVQPPWSGGEDERLRRAAERVLQQLHEQTRETANLGALRHGKVVYLRAIESPHALRHVSAPGTSDPWHCTALGRAIVAFLPPERQEILLSAPLEQRTVHTIAESDAIRRVLARVKREGYALETDQTDIGVTCVGAPVIEGEFPVAAISLSIPTARASNAARPGIIQSVLAAAALASAALKAL